MYIDVHCHLDICKDVEKAIRNAKDNKVIAVSAGIDRETNRKTLELSKKNENVKACLGIYPINALDLKDEEIDEEIDFIREKKDKILGIGEVGIDYKESENKESQKKTFEKFIRLAKELDLPIFVHSRKAELDAIEILERLEAKKVVMHCFSGKMSLVKRIEANGWSLSIPTNVVFSQHFQEVIKNVKIERLLCETDSPYLSPFKERNNEPMNIIESYKKISEIKGISLKDTEKQIEKNFDILTGKN